ncbi:cardiolipin synthase [Sphaerotilus hippei]|uniref:Cardiolipin synthase B n=1 Tax=Sphaerotilus hippei TaxID=744406 RepID=A0A318GVY6_9BURK|nr:cardiolipin synthase ClsB [Sphaerotilus hippei]PXW93498.1 cardiolipin synthase [Sphaerotilus hippei]
MSGPAAAAPGADGSDLPPWSWYLMPRPVFRPGHRLDLMRGGRELFPAMIEAIGHARHEVWLATYIFHTDDAALQVAQALEQAARRGVRVRVVIDGFGGHDGLAQIEPRLSAAGVAVTVFRPLERWTHWLQPGQLRRLHMKLCVVDGDVGFVGGINLIDDCHDLHHGRSTQPRLDYAVRVHGPVVLAMQQAVRAMWSRAWFGQDWREEARALVRAPRSFEHLRGMIRGLRLPRGSRRHEAVSRRSEHGTPALAAFVLRDNVRQRRTIERAYTQAIESASERIWLVTPYFYPGRDFRRVLREAAERGVQVRLLMQGKPDYRFAAMAARVLYDDLLRSGIEVYEYLPAFLHAKVMVVDQAWATVGSSNIDPLSLLLNLEANLIVRDVDFSLALASEIEQAFTQADMITPQRVRAQGWTGLARRTFIAWCASLYLRLAGVTGRY